MAASTEKEVPADEIVKGYEVGEDRCVILRMKSSATSLGRNPSASKSRNLSKSPRYPTCVSDSCPAICWASSRKPYYLESALSCRLSLENSAFRISNVSYFNAPRVSPRTSQRRTANPKTIIGNTVTTPIAISFPQSIPDCVMSWVAAIGIVWLPGPVNVAAKA